MRDRLIDLAARAIAAEGRAAEGRATEGRAAEGRATEGRAALGTAAEGTGAPAARPELEALLLRCAGVVHGIARSRLGDAAAAESATVDSLATAGRREERQVRSDTTPAELRRIPGWRPQST